MPKFTIEATYRLPVYRHRTYEAETFEDALRQAVEDEDWDGANEDYDTSGETYITAAWEGEASAYHGPEMPIPPEFYETVQRKAALFDEMLASLQKVKTEIDAHGSWEELGNNHCGMEVALDRVNSAVAKAESITAERGMPAA